MTARQVIRQSTIMVVDDTPANLKLLQRMLQTKGYRVLAFPSGELALNAAARSQPALILLDINMPEMDGFEVCERLKADDALKEIPVLFISALTEITDKVKAFSVGGVDYITKPFQFEEVHARVETQLELRRKRCELQEAYDKLRDLESLRDSLVHMIVHDMRSPLTIILGYLELAQNEPLPKHAEDCIGESLSAGRKLLDMISSLLDVSKMESGRMILDISSTDMTNLVRDAIRMYEPLKGQRTLILTSSEKMDSIACDARLIQRVVQNLIANALKFTDKVNGAITVGIESIADGKVRVAVADNGSGIPPEYREKVFDKFCQVEARKKGQAHSSGLGLTFCKLAVEAHGGRIGLESDEGKGSTFWFELP